MSLTGGVRSFVTLRIPLIPAKAGIQQPRSVALGPRFRGDERILVPPDDPNRSQPSQGVTSQPPSRLIASAEGRLTLAQAGELPHARATRILVGADIGIDEIGPA